MTTSYDYGLERISALNGSHRTEYLYDGRGSVAAELNYTDAWYTLGGALSSVSTISKSYTPFGEQIGEAVSGFGYNGEYYNAETGSIYLRARNYEPAMNRFSQKDILRGSISSGTSLNHYLYCANDPMNFVDANGESLKSAWNSAKSAVKSAASAVKATVSSAYKAATGATKASASASRVSGSSNSSTKASSAASMEYMYANEARMNAGGAAAYNAYYSSSFTSGKKPSADAPTIEDISPESVYYCNRKDDKNIPSIPAIKALGAGDYGAQALGEAWDKVVSWAKSDKGQKTLMTAASILEVAGGLALTIATGGTAGVLLTAVSASLIAGGASSAIGGYATEALGGNFNTGWISGQISGALTGFGIGFGGAMFSGVANAVSVSAGEIAAGFVELVGFSSAGGFAGGFLSSEYTQKAETGVSDQTISLKSGVISAAIAAMSWPFTAASATLGSITNGALSTKLTSTLLGLTEEGIFDTSGYYAGVQG